MRKHPVRKLLGLTVLYAVLIVGIFIVQFKSESVISKNIGALRFTLAQTENENKETSLRNQMQASFRGISFLCSDSDPVTVDGNPVQLVSVEQSGDLSSIVTFSDSSTLTFTLSDKSNESSLSVNANPSGKKISIPYKLNSGFAQKETTETKILVASKRANFALNAPKITEDNRVVFTSRERNASFISYDPTKRFEFDSIITLPLADAKTFDSTVKQIKTAVIRNFNSKVQNAPDSISEAEAVAYIAEMYTSNRYNEALDTVPDSIKKNSNNTYLSAPFFGKLQNKDKRLEMHLQQLKSMAESSVTSKNADIFTVSGIANFLILNKRTDLARKVLSIPGSIEKFKPSISLATGIMEVYSKIYPYDPQLAGLLENCLAACEDAVAEECSVENQRIKITENGAPLSFVQQIKTGAALIAYGNTRGRIGLTGTGNMIVNCAISNPDSLDLKTLAEIYPLLVKNTAYPHVVILGYYGQNPVWAWTSAKNISYKVDEQNTATMGVEFPQSLIHHVIIKGLPKSRSKKPIIWGLEYSQAPNFETYNTMGYYYLPETKTMLFKSRHKSSTETVKIYCTPSGSFFTPDTPAPAAPAKAVAKPVEVKKPAENSTEN